MKPSTISFLVAILSLVLPWLLSRTFFPNEPCVKDANEVVKYHSSTIGVCHCFSDTYIQAKSRFRALVQELQKKQNEISLEQLVIAGDDYTTDIAIIPGNGPGLVVHSSGIHGIEGYAGSAIQIAVLQILLEQPQPPTLPTMVLIHAINPHGMAHYRRVNENNVDLNRNGLSPQDFQTFAGPSHYNRANYDQFDETLFNPSLAPTWWTVNVEYWWYGIQALFRYGQPAVKAAMVGAQYHKPTGIFYGGRNKAERSLSLLREFWLRQDVSLLSNITTWIDVHTGLGPSGMDTMLLDHKEQWGQVEKWFPGSLNPAMAGAQAASVAQGYEQVRGTMNEYFRDVFASKEALIVTQEFGTIPTILVGQALVVENAAYQHASPEEAMEWTKRTTIPAFYPQSAAWRKRILERGVRLVRQAINRTTILSRETEQGETKTETE